MKSLWKCASKEYGAVSEEKGQDWGLRFEKGQDLGLRDKTTERRMDVKIVDSIYRYLTR